MLRIAIVNHSYSESTITLSTPSLLFATKTGLADLRFHDLRHTAATRLVSCHISLPEVGRVLGHTKPQTTYRYTNLN
jgi:integrase